MLLMQDRIFTSWTLLRWSHNLIHWDDTFFLICAYVIECQYFIRFVANDMNNDNICTFIFLLNLLIINKLEFSASWNIM